MRFLGYAGFALLAGVLAFCWYGLPRAFGVRGVRLLATTGWAALAAGTFGALLLEGPYGAGTGLGSLVRPELIGQTLAGTYGKALRARILLLAVLPFLLAYVPRLGTASRTGRAVFGGAAVFALAAIAATWSVGGHAATGTQPAGTVPADMAHLCAMGLWLGGLAAVVAVLRSGRAEPDIAAGVDRFSRVAAVAVAVLTGTGLYQGWLRVRTIEALSATPYGITLTVKAGLVGLLLCAAFFSRRALRRGESGRLARLVAVETAGAVAVLAVTALLVEMEPADKALAAEPVTLTSRYDSGGLRGSVLVRLPNRARGLSIATVAVRDDAGRLRDVPELRMRWSLPERGIGPIDARIGHDGTGRYTATTAPITVAGRWRIDLTVRTGDIDETTLHLTQTIR